MATNNPKSLSAHLTDEEAVHERIDSIQSSAGDLKTSDRDVSNILDDYLVRSPLTEILTRSLRTGFILFDWKSANITAIIKKKSRRETSVTDQSVSLLWTARTWKG